MGNLQWQARDDRADFLLADLTALQQIKTAQHRGRLDFGDDPAPSRRIEAMSLQPQRYLRTESIEKRQVDGLKKVAGRRKGIVRSPGNNDPRSLTRQAQRRQNGLQHERRAACSPNLEIVNSADNRLRTELQFSASQSRAADRGVADPRGCFNGHQVLRLQARPLPPGANPQQSDRPPGD